MKRKNKNGVTVRDVNEFGGTKFVASERQLEAIAKHSVTVWKEQVKHRGIVNIADMEVESESQD